MAHPSSTPVGARTGELHPETGRRSTLSLLTISLRPEQWTKNLLLFAGLLFGGRLLQLDEVLTATAAFAIFCGLSGAVYLFNDGQDRDVDARHPLKRARPVASGDLRATTAQLPAVVLIGVAMTGALFMAPAFAAAAAAYTLLLLYSVALKHVVIIDVLTIAGGFVLRAMAGALAVDVPIGSWLLACTTLLALFLAFSKRRHELVLLGEGAGDHRRILDEYSPYLLDQMIRRGFLRPLEHLLLHSPLMVRAPFASNVYHDMFWYPTIGQSRIRSFMRTEWGQLFRKY